MGFSGWDGPKEHKFRKNKKAFKAVKHYYKYRNPKGINYQHKRLEGIEYEKRYGLKIILRNSLLVIAALCLTWAIYDDILKFLLTRNPSDDEMIGEYKKRADDNAYEVMMKTGVNYFEGKSYKWAINEFERSRRIYPDRLEPKYQLTLSYCHLCIMSNDSCETAIKELNEFSHLIEGLDNWNENREYLAIVKDLILKEQ